ncbi:MAG: FKBP-type peptidyl-prolyl cis-trans isomerase [Planctomycetota bacterium]
MTSSPRLLTASSVFTAILLSAIGCSGLAPGPGPEDPDAPTSFSTTDSGLRYRITRKSDRSKPGSASDVKVQYIGKLEDGTVFDNSYTRGEGVIFNLGEVVKGWREGLMLLGEGGMIELEVPPDLGYGEAGKPPKIPPNATLKFTVELIRVF